MSARILIGDCRLRLRELADGSVDSVVCDPPYHLTSIVKRFGAENAAPAKVGQTGAYARVSRGFMGQTWDGGDVAFDPATWAEVLRVLKPGGHLIAFSGTRTYHRMVCAIEDAGFEIRDQLAWVYGSGFPKSLDVSKQIDKAAGAEREVVALNPNHRAVSGVEYEGVYSGGNTGAKHITAPATDAAREWQGWGTALKPSWEPICLARKPLIGTVAGNVLAHGTGALNIDGCRIEAGEGENFVRPANHTGRHEGWTRPWMSDPDANERLQERKDEAAAKAADLGRWPANLCHDGSEEVVSHFPEQESGGTPASRNADKFRTCYGAFKGGEVETGIGSSSGSAARFFYCAKATTEERGEGNDHPTVKPIALMRWLVRLITPKGGTVLDPFMGSGSTLLAAEAEQFNAIGCEMSPEYAAIAERRLKAAGGMFADVSICLGEAA